MSAAVAEYELVPLLEQAGARPRGNRHDCPKCGGVRTVTHTAECFYCHRCQWKGNAVTLAKELGIRRAWLPRAEYIRQQQDRERAHKAAARLAAAVHTRRMELLGSLQYLNRLEAVAHDAGADDAATWGALALACRDRQPVLAELAILENCGAPDLIRFLSGDPETRERAIDAVLTAGGLYRCAGRFVEVSA